MKIDFTKMQGLGNDYIYLNCLEATPDHPQQLARLLSDRHFGVGADGLVLILPSESADFQMRMFNADGSEGNMCGNAARCVGKYVYEKGLTRRTNLALETKAGIKMLSLHTTPEHKVGTVTVDMGAPIFTPEAIPLSAESNRISLPTGDRNTDAFCLSMGNPHCVLFVDDLAAAHVHSLGPALEKDDRFTEGVNVEFVTVCSEGELHVRVWERGSGETMACGTGACAAAVAAVENGFCPLGQEIAVKLPGGCLSIKVTPQTVYMTGPAQFVFEGSVDTETLS